MIDRIAALMFAGSAVVMVVEQGSADQSIARAGRGIPAPMEHRDHPRAYPDLRIKYLALSITPTGSIQKRSTPLFAAGALIALGAAVLFVLGL